MQKQQLSKPHLGWAIRPDAFQLPLVFQDHFLQVMQFSTGSDGSVHLTPGTKEEKSEEQWERRRAKER